MHNDAGACMWYDFETTMVMVVGQEERSDLWKVKTILLSMVDRGRRLMAATRGDSMSILSLFTEMLRLPEGYRSQSSTQTLRARLLQQVSIRDVFGPWGALRIAAVGSWGWKQGNRGGPRLLRRDVRLRSAPGRRLHITRHRGGSPVYSTLARSNAGTQRNQTGPRVQPLTRTG